MARWTQAATTAALHARWAAGGAVFAPWLTTGSPEVAEIVGATGVDAAVLDVQHGAIDAGRIPELLRALAVSDTPALVRTMNGDAAQVGFVLDQGANGVIVPMIETRAQAEAIVRQCRYGPAGSRSWGAMRPALADAGYEPAGGDAGVVCIALVETAAGVAAIDEIVAVEGLDGVMVGPSDLAISLGAPPRMLPDEPAVLEAVDLVLAACTAAGVVPGIYGGTAEAALVWAERGFRFVGLLSDAAIVAAGMRALVDRLGDRDRASGP